MASRQINPPKFGNGESYKAWKSKIATWSSVTGHEKKAQGILVRLQSFQEHLKADKAVSNRTVEDLSNDGGLEALLAKLDESFKKEEVDEAYAAYSEFNSSARNEGQSMLDYILDFEQKYTRLTQHNMELPDAVQAFKLLDGAHLEADKRQLVLTIGRDLKYSSMKSALKRIFCQKHAEEEHPRLDIKQENLYWSTVRSKRARKLPDKTGSSVERSHKNQWNPKDRFGNVTRCSLCDSRMHWVKDCPHSYQNKVFCARGTDNANSSDCEDVEVVFITRRNFNETSDMQSSKYAIIDTACTKTVAGYNWFHRYVNLLSDLAKEKIQTFPSERWFRFGDGQRVKALQKALIPVQIGNVFPMLEVELVSGEIPLLLSKASLKRAEGVIDTKNDQVVLSGHTLPLIASRGGHYAVDILPKEDISSSDILLNNDDGKTLNKKDIIKLHNQFGHASKENMKKLLKNSGRYDQKLESFIESTVDDCRTCIKFKRPPARPVVSLPWGENFNDTVAMDLHQIDVSIWYMHMVDLLTKYSRAVIIRSKRSSLVTQKFMQEWISVFGAPSMILVDNGGEFDSDEFRDMCGTFAIKIITTPAYSPWSNGVCERHNMVLSDIFLKVKEANNCDLETAIAWAVCAKNSLVNLSGFTSNQLVFGVNLSLPSVIHDQLPALDGPSASSSVAKNILAMHMARKACISSESSEKVRRALLKNTRNSRNCYGAEVYYKREDQKKWKGPGTVIGQDGVVVFVRHGGQHVKVHSCRVQLASLGKPDSVKEDEGPPVQSDNDIKGEGHYGTDETDSISEDSEYDPADDRSGIGAHSSEDATHRNGPVGSTDSASPNWYDVAGESPPRKRNS